MNKLNSQTIIAFARLAVTLILSVAAVFGWALDWSPIYNIIISALGIAMLVWSWWKNNNVTEAAQESQLLLDELKAAKDAEDPLTIAEQQSLKDHAENTAKHARVD